MTQFDPAAHRQRWREILEELDIPDPDGIVEADAGSTNAHVAAHVLVAGIWRLVIEPWRSQRAWQTEWAGQTPFPELDQAADALARLQVLGASPEEIGLVAWRVAADAVLCTLIHVTGEEESGEPLDAGTLYAVLARQERRGLIEAFALEERRRRHRLTQAGAEALAAHLAGLERRLQAGRPRFAGYQP